MDDLLLYLPSVQFASKVSGQPRRMYPTNQPTRPQSLMAIMALTSGNGIYDKE